MQSPDQTPAYDEFSIRFQPEGGKRYRATASAPDGSTGTGVFEMPFGETELDNFVLRIGRQRLPMRSYRSTQMEEAKQFGSRLFEALIVDELRDVFRSAQAVADSSNRGMRITLCLTDAPELMDVPWEFLYERPRFLAQSIYSPVVRSLDLTEIRVPRPVQLPLNVLGMVSAPHGFGILDVEREKEKVTSALRPLIDRGAVKVDWLEKGTLKNLDDAMSQGRGIHAFHYIGHGGYDPSGCGILVLENEAGDPHEVSGEELGLLLQDERALRLAVLNSCEGARSSHLDPFSGVASSLVQYGTPAVIGMQFEITDEAAIACSSRLYAALAQGLPVDAALAQARRSIFAAGNDIEFGTPVLFLRGADARLFDLLDTPLDDADATAQGTPEPWPEASEDSAEPAPAATDEPIEDWPEEVVSVPPSLPASLSWLPRPWQDWLIEARWNTRDAWHRWSARQRNGRLAIRFGILFLAGALLSEIFGAENASGNREHPIGTLLLLIGLVGFCWVVFRVLALRVRRIRDWWTGSGR